MDKIGWRPEVEETDPYWGPPTATLNWCEKDYAISRYVAEFINTITNIWGVMIALAIWCIFKYNLPKRYIILWLGVSCVAMGSWMFHMTLKWEWQVLGDEIPMIIAESSVLFIVLETVKDTEPKHVQRRSIIINGLGVATLVISVSAIYLYTGYAPFHQFCFGAIQILTFIRFLHLLRTEIRADDPDIELRRKRAQVLKVCLTGAVTFFFGFVCWNIDNILCYWLTLAKTQLGRPLSFLLELHGWWHLMTGYGAYLMAMASQMLTLMIKEGHEPFEMQMWWGWLPQIVRVRYVEKDR